MYFLDFGFCGCLGFLDLCLCGSVDIWAPRRAFPRVVGVSEHIYIYTHIHMCMCRYVDLYVFIQSMPQIQFASPTVDATKLEHDRAPDPNQRKTSVSYRTSIPKSILLAGSFVKFLQQPQTHQHISACQNFSSPGSTLGFQRLVKEE